MPLLTLSPCLVKEVFKKWTWLYVCMYDYIAVSTRTLTPPWLCHTSCDVASPSIMVLSSGKHTGKWRLLLVWRTRKL